MHIIQSIKLNLIQLISYYKENVFFISQEYVKFRISPSKHSSSSKILTYYCSSCMYVNYLIGKLSMSLVF